MPIIELKNITHSYKDKTIISDLSLEFESNKLTCLLGSSGSGKTTILRLIAGLEIPGNGEILIEDKIVTRNNEILVPPQKRNLGFIFQDLALWPHFSIYKNIAFGLIERNEENIEKKVHDILNYFNILEHKEKFPHQLSGGQKQLVAIARALVLQPKILLMDEPLANLDVKLKRKLLEYIKTLREKFNLTIIYVTHDHREAFTISDNIVVLNDGKIEDYGTVEHIKASKNNYIKYFLEY